MNMAPGSETSEAGPDDVLDSQPTKNAKKVTKVERKRMKKAHLALEEQGGGLNQLDYDCGHFDDELVVDRNVVMTLREYKVGVRSRAAARASAACRAPTPAPRDRARARGFARTLPQEKLRHEREVNKYINRKVASIKEQLNIVNSELEEFAEYI